MWKFSGAVTRSAIVVLSFAAAVVSSRALGYYNLAAFWRRTAPSPVWTWISGLNGTAQAGNCGTKGVAASTNMPGARWGHVSWYDPSHNGWIFGGGSYPCTGANGDTNDLWKWDGTNWTWVSGSNTSGQKGTYGTINVAASTNVPGARDTFVSWVGTNGHLWLFGGNGYAASGSSGDLNDLWEWDGTNWTWRSGASTTGQKGTYGTKGTAASSNVPGSRYGGVSWTDSSGNFWLFGGSGNAATNPAGSLNDLWKWDGTNWTWVSGGNNSNNGGVYGTQGVAAASNVPGARWGAMGWIDSSNNLWLFGGNGYAASGSSGFLNDLWKFDGTNWTWVSGSTATGATGVYGTKGVAAPSNVPGSRAYGQAWIDSSNKLWLFGGGVTSTNNANDLWKFDGTNWTWVSGDSAFDGTGVYGTLGTGAATNKPGPRNQGAGWVDSSGRFVLFGGIGNGVTTTKDSLNDLWTYQ